MQIEEDGHHHKDNGKESQQSSRAQQKEWTQSTNEWAKTGHCRDSAEGLGILLRAIRFTPELTEEHNAHLMGIFIGGIKEERENVEIME